MRALIRMIVLVAMALTISAPAHAYRQRKVSTTSYPNCFKLVDSSDHVTPKTGATITCTRSKNGGSFGSCSGSVSEVASGIYCLAGNATDRDTVGTLVFHMTASGADNNDFEIEITTNDPFTNLDTSTAVASVTGAVGSVTGNVGGNVVGSVGSVTGNVGGNITGSVGSVAADGITANSIATDAIGPDEIAAGAVTEIQNGLATPADIPTAAQIADATWDEDLSGHSTAGSAGKKLFDIPTSSSLTALDVANEVWRGTTYGPSTWTVPNSAGYLLALKMALISSGAITVASPVAPNGIDLNLVPGTSYVTSPHSRAVIFGPLSAAAPDLTDATPRLVIMQDTTTIIGVDGTVTGAGTSAQYVVFQLTAADTALLTSIGPKSYQHQVNATWAADDPVQPVRLLSGNTNTDLTYQQ